MPEEINWDEQNAAHALYANYMRVGHNAFEFFLDFGQRFEDTGEEQFHTRIVTSPEHFESFVGTALGSLEGYRGLAAQGAPEPASTSREQVLSLLASLDELLKRSGTKLEASLGEQKADPAATYRGLYVSREEFDRLLEQKPGTPVASAVAEGGSDLSAFSAKLFPAFLTPPLTPWENAVVVMALAAELDARYERLYAWLQDDVTRKRPTVNLALEVLSRDARERIEGMARFSEDAPLLRNGIIHLVPDPNQFRPSLLDHAIQLDPQILSFLLGRPDLDSRIREFATLVAPAQGGTSFLPAGLEPLAAAALTEGRLLCLQFSGPDEQRKRAAAAELGAALNMPVLRVDAQRMARSEPGNDTLRALGRAALLNNALVMVEGFDQLSKTALAADLPAIWSTITRRPGPVILTGAEPWIPAPGGPSGVLSIPFRTPDYDTRRAAWQRELAAAGIPAPDPTLDSLANSFELREDQIFDAVSTARNQMELAAGQTGQPLLSQPYTAALYKAARSRTGHALSELARKTEPVYQWNDIVLPAALMAQLAEICDRVEQRHRVYDEWGFGAKLSGGKGITVLLSGPPGTGKTMAAEVIASQTGLDLYTIDLSRIVSKFIGETEERLERVFTAAEQTNAILLFNEADAVFGKRSEVRDAHDRYANIEVSYLLQRMEMYEGISLLATNLRGNLDEAFLRRLTYVLPFPLPDEQARLRIWEQVWPAREQQVADEVDFAKLAAQFKLTGANIRNVALAASFYAAAAGTRVTNEHIVRALLREYQKVGRTISLEEIGASMALEGAA